MTRLPYSRKLTPELIMILHDLLPQDASTNSIKAAAFLADLSYSTVWHIVRGWDRRADALWRKLPAFEPIPIEGESTP